MRAYCFCVLLLFSSYSFADRVEFSNAQLGELVAFLAPKLERTVVIGADLSAKKVSLYGSYDSPQQLEFLLQRAIESVGLFYSVSGDVATISSMVQSSPQMYSDPDDVEFYDSASAPTSMVSAPTDRYAVSHVFKLAHVQSSFAVDALLPFFSTEQGASRPLLMASPTTNSIIFSGSQSQLEVMMLLVSEIDHQRAQVLITAVVAELSDTDFESLGVNIKGTADHLSAGSLTLKNRSDLGVELTFTGPRLGAFLQAVQNSGNNRVLSTPQLLVLNREKASIVVGQNVPFLTGTTTSAATPADNPYQTITRQDVGLTLDVTPFITPSGDVELDIKQSASSVSNDRTASDVITNTRRLNTKIKLRNGDGVLLGGLRQQTTEDTVSGIPGLRNIPWIGRLFEYRSSNTKSTNLVVLISARIYEDSAPSRVHGIDSASQLNGALGSFK